MKTITINSSKAVKSSASAENGKDGGKTQGQKTGALPVSAKFDEPAKNETPKKEAAAVQVPDRTKGAIKEQLKVVAPVLNLESTLKLVEELHRRKRQRDRLIRTIDNLGAFEVAQMDDAEEKGDNPYQNSVLVIEDDERRRFDTKNRVIIQAVAEYIRALCGERLAEIEAEIVIPS